MYTVARQVQIPAPVTRVWQYLTQPALLARWFADPDRFELGRPFRLSFGDGDFFAGIVNEWDEAGCLRLEWKFMDLGARYDVAFFLTPLEGPATELTVADRGCLTLDEMNALREGWADFLGRLALCAQTGQSTRLTWSEAIGISALVPDAAELPARLRSPDWWRSAFPDAQVKLREPHNGVALQAAFRSQAWGRLETEAEVRLERVPAGACLSVVHRGWPRLPDGVRLAERRRYAECWQRALKSLEEEEGDGVEGDELVAAEVAPARRRARGDRF